MMDTLSHHWYKFRWKDTVNETWWNPETSWANKYINEEEYGFKLTQISDAWHVFKTLRIVSIISAIVVYQPMTNRLLDLIILGVLHNVVFSLFYNKLLVKS